MWRLSSGGSPETHAIRDRRRGIGFTVSSRRNNAKPNTSDHDRNRLEMRWNKLSNEQNQVWKQAPSMYDSITFLYRLIHKLAFRQIYNSALLAASLDALTGLGDSKIACISSIVRPEQLATGLRGNTPLVSG